MAVPKSKITVSRRNKRRAHDRAFYSTKQECPNCGEIKIRHHICKACGYYDGRQIVAQKTAS